MADVEDFVFAIDIGDLMDKAVLFRKFQDAHCFIVIDGTGFSGFNSIVCHIANLNAPIFRIISAAIA